MRDYFLIGFLLLLPAFGALGHDLYMAYNNTELEGIDRFWFSDVGWLWINYYPDSYDWAIANVDQALWNNLIDPVLQESAFFVALLPFFIFLPVVILMMIFGLGAFEGKGLFRPRLRAGKGGKKSFSFSHEGSKQRIKYKRK